MSGFFKNDEPCESLNSRAARVVNSGGGGRAGGRDAGEGRIEQLP